jgi:hypothetical protein
MTKANTNEDKGFLNRIVNLVQGVLIGAFSWIPFVNVNDLVETMGIKPVYQEKQTIAHKYLFFFKKRWATLLGIIIGMILFFLIPVSYLTTNFPVSTYSALLIFLVGFSLLTIYKIVKAKDEKWLTFLIPFFISFAVGIALYYIDFSRITNIYTGAGYAAIILLMAIASFVCTYSGESIGSVFLLGSFYLTTSSAFGNVSRLKNLKGNFLLVASFVLGALIGWIIGYYVGNKDAKSLKAKGGVKLGINLSGIIVLFLSRIKGPFFNDISTLTAQSITFACVVFGSLMVVVGLTIYGYPFFKDKDEEEEKIELPSNYQLLTEGLDSTNTSKETTIARKPLATKMAESTTNTNHSPIKEESKTEVKKDTVSGIDISKLKALQEELKK